MKKILAIFILFFGAYASAGAAEFMSAFEEIPLQDGLSEEEPFSFDTEEARIIEQYVSSPTLKKSEFVKFYAGTLPALGWKLAKQTENSLSFRREEEELVLSIESADPLVARFSLRPYGK
ncbi:MAG: hypothetical protein LBO78_03745 [Rickettsiales bacterium]|jgi:hypothetical protein|nr:hypothetical protein [Rickettsiales bacterium]